MGRPVPPLSAATRNSARGAAERMSCRTPPQLAGASAAEGGWLGRGGRAGRKIGALNRAWDSFFPPGGLPGGGPDEQPDDLAVLVEADLPDPFPGFE
jgi:hypothetical protein